MQVGINRKSFRGATLCGAMLAAGFAAHSAQGALTLTLSEPGFGPQTVVDGSASGTVVFTNPYGDFKTNIVIGFSDKLGAAPTDPAQLQIQELEITSNASVVGKRVLTITLSDDGFTFPGSATSSLLLSSSLGGTINNAAAGDSITFQSSAQPSGATPGLQTSIVPAGNSSFSMPVATTTFLRGASYNLTNVTTISLSNANESTNLAGTTTASAVPEPASLSLLGLAGIATLARRRKA